MTKITQRTFTAGELDPALHQRADLARYQAGLALCKNFIIRAQGGAYNRPGTRFVGEVKDSTRATRLIPFQFNTEQTYILEFGHLTMRVIRGGAYVLAGGGPAIYEIATPYTETDLFDLQYAQTADVMTIVSRNHAVRELARTGHDAWTLSTANFSSSVASPTILSITAVGAGAGANSKTYRYVVTATDTNGVESLASPEAGLTTASLGVTAGIRLTWSPVAGADFYTVYKDDANGTGIYGLIGESENLTYDDYNIGPDTSKTPPKENTPISTAGNYPGTVGFYQQRRLFANTDNAPQTMYASQTSIYNSLRFSTPQRDDDAITFTIAARQVNEIRHIVALGDLILLTSGAEYKVTEGQDFVLTPSTIGAKVQSYSGASKVRPAVINDNVIFVQEKGGRLRDLNYSLADDKNIGDDLSLLAEHLFQDSTVKEMTFAAEPYGILWCVMEDGTVRAMTYQREHQVWGWHQHEFSGGVVESVASITESGRDAPYFVIRRTVNGNTVRYVERLEPRYDATPEDAFFIDSGLSYNGVPVTNLAGLDHLEGEEVVVLADGNVVRGLTVTAGAVTIPRAASVVHIGLEYECDIETLGIDTQQETTQGRKKSVNEVALRFYRSRGAWVGPDFDNLVEIKPRFDSDGYGTVALKTDERRVTIQPEWNADGKVAIRHRDPLPMGILGITPEFDIGG